MTRQTLTCSVALILVDVLAPASASAEPPWKVRLARTESDIVVHTHRGRVIAQDGETGEEIISDPDAAIVINKALDVLHEMDRETPGGKIFIKAGTYNLCSTYIGYESPVRSFGLGDNVMIEGTEGTILTSDDSDNCAGQEMIRIHGDGNVTLSRLTFRDCAAEAVRIRGGANVRILGCRFKAIARQGVVAQEDPVHGLWIEDCTVRGAGKASSASGRPFYTGIHVRGGSKDVIIRNNVVQYCGSTGIGVGGAHRALIEGNISSFNDRKDVLGQGHGIIATKNRKSVIRNNITVGNGGNGIEVSGGESPPENVVISENLCIGNGIHGTGRGGIYVIGSNITLCNNICIENRSCGIKIGWADKVKHVLVQGNVVGDNNQNLYTTAREGSGIRVNGGNDTSIYDEKIHITDNLVFDAQLGADGVTPSPTQLWGISCRNDRVDGVLIEGNRLYGNIDGQIKFDPDMPNMIVRRNVGFATEAGGEAAIRGAEEPCSGTCEDCGTCVKVDHELDITPALDYIQVTPKGNLMVDGAARSFWVQDVGATSFKIYVSSNPGIGHTLEFGWTYVAP